MSGPRSILAAAAAAAAILAGCGSGSGTPAVPAAPATSSPSGASSVTFNDQDVTFASDMIVHHRQAVEMAGLAPGRTTTPDVLALAAEIAAAQTPEIHAMSDSLSGWGHPVPEDMAGMDMSGDMPGMMSVADMSALERLKGAEFDRQLVTMMIAHHEGALTMATTETQAGRDVQTMEFAEKVVADQTAQIAQMRAMLG